MALAGNLPARCHCKSEEGSNRCSLRSSLVVCRLPQNCSVRMGILCTAFDSTCLGTAQSGKGDTTSGRACHCTSPQNKAQAAWSRRHNSFPPGIQCMQKCPPRFDTSRVHTTGTRTSCSGRLDCCKFPLSKVHMRQRRRHYFMFLSDRRNTKWIPIPTHRCQDHSRNKPALTTGRRGDGREGSTFMGLAKRMDKIKNGHR